jgi:hypothetical protein
MSDLDPGVLCEEELWRRNFPFESPGVEYCIGRLAGRKHKGRCYHEMTSDGNLRGSFALRKELKYYVTHY